MNISKFRSFSLGNNLFDFSEVILVRGDLVSALALLPVPRKRTAEMQAFSACGSHSLAAKQRTVRGEASALDASGWTAWHHDSWSTLNSLSFRISISFYSVIEAFRT